MAKKKAKSGNYWRLASIVMADYVRALVHIQYATCSSKSDLDLYVQMIMNTKSIIKRDGEVTIQSDQSTESNTNELIRDLTAVENNAVVRLQTFDFAEEYKKRKSVVVEDDKFKNLPEKLLANITKLINSDDNLAFAEFTHGAGTYRIVYNGSNYTLMSYTKKLDSWSDRTIFTTRKK